MKDQDYLRHIFRILGKSPDFIGKFPLSVTQNSPIFASEIRTTDV